MTRVNTQLQVNPALQHMPKDQREWHHFINEFAKWVVDVDTDGVMTSELPLPQVLLFNRGSVQSAVPGTATDAGASATISIAAHTVETLNRSVSYNAGSVTGLSYDTTYYVYTDDPSYAGGAVTYAATTTRTDVPSSIGRYFVGTVHTPAAAESDTTGSVGAGFGFLDGFTFTALSGFGDVGTGSTQVAQGDHNHAGSKNITILSPTTSEDAQMWYTTVAITISELVAVCVGTTPSLTWTLRHHTDRSNAGNEVVTGGTTTTSETTGDVITSFNDATIPADSFIWLETSASAGTVDSFALSVRFTED